MSLLSEWLCAAAFASQRRFNENVATRYSCFDAGYLRVASIKVGPTQGTTAGNHWRQTGPSRWRESRVCSCTPWPSAGSSMRSAMVPSAPLIESILHLLAASALAWSAVPGGCRVTTPETTTGRADDVVVLDVLSMVRGDSFVGTTAASASPNRNSDGSAESFKPLPDGLGDTIPHNLVEDCATATPRASHLVPVLRRRHACCRSGVATS